MTQNELDALQKTSADHEYASGVFYRASAAFQAERNQLQDAIAAALKLPRYRLVLGYRRNREAENTRMLTDPENPTRGEWIRVSDLLQALAPARTTNAIDPVGESDNETTPRDLLTYACGCVLGPDRGWVPCRPHQFVPVTSPTTR